MKPVQYSILAALAVTMYAGADDPRARGNQFVPFLSAMISRACREK
jgi:hypothetical protein